jgi:hypothetical protein
MQLDCPSARHLKLTFAFAFMSSVGSVAIIEREVAMAGLTAPRMEMSDVSWTDDLFVPRNVKESMTITTLTCEAKYETVTRREPADGEASSEASVLAAAFSALLLESSLTLEEPSLSSDSSESAGSRSIRSSGSQLPRLTTEAEDRLFLSRVRPGGSTILGWGSWSGTLSPLMDWLSSSFVVAGVFLSRLSSWGIGVLSAANGYHANGSSLIFVLFLRSAESTSPPWSAMRGVFGLVVVIFSSSVVSMCQKLPFEFWRSENVK